MKRTDLPTSAELLVLLLTARKEPVSGYLLRSMIAEQKLESLVPAKSTTVYLALKKLATRGLIMRTVCTKRSGKGPKPNLYKTKPGAEAAIAELVASCAALAPAADERFALALAGASLLSKDALLAALRERVRRLAEDSRELVRARGERPQEPDPIRGLQSAVIDHPLFLMEQEIRYTRSLIERLAS